MFPLDKIKLGPLVCPPSEPQFFPVSVAPCRTFTVTAVAQLCVLGLTWIFGCFQFDDRTMIMSYLFTISGSLQGVMMFVFHCLFSKQVGHCHHLHVGLRGLCLTLCRGLCPQVREEYGSILSRLCAPSKKNYSEFSSLSSKQQVCVDSTHFATSAN